jgi:hypothetical protein
MKDCCKTGDEPKQSNIIRWVKRSVWGAVLLVIIIVFVKQYLNQ